MLMRCFINLLFVVKDTLIMSYLGYIWLHNVVSQCWNDVSVSIATNVLGLCEEAELEAQMFNLAQMFIRIPNVQFSTEPAFLQNPC